MLTILVVVNNILMNDFKSFEYLKTGNPRQKQAYLTLKKCRIRENLHEFEPVLVGTIPIEIDLPESDLDIACFCNDHLEFALKVKSCYGNEPSFNIRTQAVNGILSTVAEFITSGFRIEIFGQNLPVSQQNGYKHLVIESKILQKRGGLFRNEVKKLKAQGYKTEPAFAKLLGLEGDPYKELLNIKFP